MGLGRPARLGSQATACTASYTGCVPWTSLVLPTWSMSTGQQNMQLALSDQLGHWVQHSSWGISENGISLPSTPTDLDAEQACVSTINMPTGAWHHVRSNWHCSSPTRNGQIL